jgi:hypothetical protein
VVPVADEAILIATVSKAKYSSSSHSRCRNAMPRKNHVACGTAESTPPLNALIIGRILRVRYNDGLLILLTTCYRFLSLQDISASSTPDTANTLVQESLRFGHDAKWRQSKKSGHTM